MTESSSDQAHDRARQASRPRKYVVVLRARSAAKFRPEEGQELFLNDLMGYTGIARARLRTRWVDEGFEAPIPRELWIEVAGEARSLDEAMSAATALGRLLTAIAAFCANATVGQAEVHLAYDDTDGESEREFLEVFIPDETGLPTEGRPIEPIEFGAVLTALDSSAEDARRISQAIYQYEIALRSWHYGGEWLALAHLYMAVETLTIAMLRRKCDTDGMSIEELAQSVGIDPYAPARPRWRPALESWCREHLIFNGDHINYEKAKEASDGLEHGYLDLSTINRQAMESTEITFKYVRTAIIALLELGSSEELAARVPRDTQSMRKMIRGVFIGVGPDLAAPGEEYPRLEWRSAVRTLTRVGDEFNVSFAESFKVRSAAGVSFRGEAFEIRGRSESGGEPIRLEPVGEISVVGSDASDSSNEVRELAVRASRYCTDIAAPGGSQGVPREGIMTYELFCEQIALFEGLDTLVRADRPVEAMILLERLMTGTSRLQILSADREQTGARIRMRLDTIQRRRLLLASNTDALTALDREEAELIELAEASGISIPVKFPDVDSMPFHLAHLDEYAFVQEVARADNFAVDLRTRTDDEGNLSIRTQIVEPTLTAGIVGLAVQAVVESAILLAREFRWPHDEAAGTTLLEDAARIANEEDETAHGEPGARVRTK